MDSFSFIYSLHKNDAAKLPPFFLHAWHMGNTASYEEEQPEWNEEGTEVTAPVRKRVTRAKTKRANARKRQGSGGAIGTAAHRPRLRKRVEEQPNSYEESS